MGDFANFLEKSKKVVALDFDGVIHNDSKGFFNGTIYGEPMEGTETALKYLSENYKIVIFSCKSNPNRPLINDKTGTQLIWDWLESYNFKQYISDVVWGKPNAFVYVVDKGFTFKNWTDTLEHIKYIK